LFGHYSPPAFDPLKVIENVLSAAFGGLLYLLLFTSTTRSPEAISLMENPVYALNCLERAKTAKPLNDHSIFDDAKVVIGC
jgi:hypothetical protein